jgi:hypothetical protein
MLSASSQHDVITHVSYRVSIRVTFVSPTIEPF